MNVCLQPSNFLENNLKLHPLTSISDAAEAYNSAPCGQD